MKSDFAIAIIGCGMIAGRFEDISNDRIYSHAKAFRSISANGKMGFYDINNAYSVEMAKKYNGFSYMDIESMLQDLTPSIVAICSPDEFHFQHIIKVIESKYKPQVFFIEKPVCLNSTELEQVIKAQEKCDNVKIYVNHSRRFDSKHREVAEIIEKRKYGEFKYCQINYYGGWLHLGVHLIDFLDLCFRCAIDVMSIHYACESRYLDDDTIHVNGLLAGGEVQLRGYDENYYQIFEIDLFFEKGRIRISDFGMQIDYYDKIINAEQENVLLHDTQASGSAMSNQMLTAYNELFMSLNNNKSRILDMVSLKCISAVMKELWRINDQYKKM